MEEILTAFTSTSHFPLLRKKKKKKRKYEKVYKISHLKTKLKISKT